MKKLTYLLAMMFSITLVFTLSACRDWEAVKKALEEQQMEGATFVGSETCALCHEDVTKEFPLSTHHQISIPIEGAEVEGCEMCHGPGSKHVDAADGSHIINPDKSPEACFMCHTEKKNEFNLPFRHPVLEGKMSCTDCHDPHGPDASSWSMASIDGVNEACVKCHKEQNGPFVFKHEAVEEGCTSCHQVHGSITDKMLISRDSTLCMRCHSQETLPNIGDSGHATRMPGGTCFSAGCHVAVHGSNFDDHLRS